MDKKDIIEVLERIGTMLEIKGENPFKIRAYFSGARTLQTMEEDLGEVIGEGRLGEIPGIGKALTEKVETLYTTGELEFYDKLVASVPSGLMDLLEVPGLGGKKIKALHEQLDVDSIDSLTKACKEGKVAELKGFGAKTQEKILSGIKNREAYAARHLWWDARAVVERILPALQALPDVERAEAAGSFRRGMETVGDLDFIVASSNPVPIMEWFVGMEGITEVTAHGETKSSIRLEGGMQADLRVVPTEQFYFALHHFTGSKDHNVRMRQKALSMGLSLSEWGLRPEEEKNATRKTGPVCASSEEDVFKALGLSYVPPALREGVGEVEAAEKDELPKLLNFEDLQGCFHNHTTASDGRNSLREMAGEADKRGWAYLGIADHSKSSFQANGLDEERLLKQVHVIQAINDSGEFRVRLFSGSEVDILTEGRLDFEDSVLESLDYVVASVHNGLTQDEDTMTTRLIRAIEHPQVTMLGHLSGRLLLRREASKMNVQKIIDAALANGKILELNANPMRLDMDWRHWRKAADRGLLCCINPDAHALHHFDFQYAGVLAARKGWLQREQVFNTRTLPEVLTYLGLN
ncbi:DNA polymerase/3'-5' exonuclease PolX [Opitutales bacterium]|nr:DNA polymerase/3'-5' exonuclease PolX [Opitutales bacterium]MDB3957568.1 DNA polymerase/3'-5' exonuclease PolX [Opitutales bacterium]